MAAFDAPQRTDSVKFKQDEWGMKCELVLKGEFKYLPRLRRAPNSGMFQCLFLCLDPKKGIEAGAYSTLRMAYTPLIPHDYNPLIWHYLPIANSIIKFKIINVQKANYSFYPLPFKRGFK